MVTYDKYGNCTTCGMPGTGFIEDGVCMCLELREGVHDIGCTCKKCEDLWDEIEASNYSRLDCGYEYL